MRSQWNGRVDPQARITSGLNEITLFIRTGRRKNAKNPIMISSVRNRLPGTVEKIVSDKVVSEIIIRTSAGEVTSVITTGSVQRMNLKEGDHVFAVIKATEVSVEKQ